MLQPVERGLARQRGDVGALGLERVGQKAEHGIVAQLVVVVEVLVAERNGVHALRDQRLQLVHDAVLVAAVAKTASDFGGQPDGAVGFARQHRAAVRGHRSAIETTHNLTALEGFKCELGRATLCRHRSGLLLQGK